MRYYFVVNTSTMIILGLTLLVVALYLVFTIALPLVIEVMSLLILSVAAPFRSIMYNYRQGRKKKALIQSIALAAAIAAIVVAIIVL